MFLVIYDYSWRNSFMKDADHSLKERVKELKCLYGISKVAREAKTDVKALASKALEIIPGAMQFPQLAETEIRINGETFETRGFRNNATFIKAGLSIGKKKYGSLAIGYRAHGRKNEKPRF